MPPAAGTGTGPRRTVLGGVYPATESCRWCTSCPPIPPWSGHAPGSRPLEHNTTECPQSSATTTRSRQPARQNNSSLVQESLAVALALNEQFKSSRRQQAAGFCGSEGRFATESEALLAAADQKFTTSRLLYTTYIHNTTVREWNCLPLEEGKVEGCHMLKQIKTKGRIVSDLKHRMEIGTAAMLALSGAVRCPERETPHRLCTDRRRTKANLVASQAQRGGPDLDKASSLGLYYDSSFKGRRAPVGEGMGRRPLTVSLHDTDMYNGGKERARVKTERQSRLKDRKTKGPQCAEAPKGGVPKPSTKLPRGGDTSTGMVPAQTSGKERHSRPIMLAATNLSKQCKHGAPHSLPFRSCGKVRTFTHTQRDEV
ncbi:hypothetical protein PoB_006573400 [Plakobranchus ocellatus]|uniref:Uncharacterized protein n=1 Tax=Plakobranchus ocellatus TaxID=259542 RepID=A0AAV4D4Z8_9GAST|nr:hypothetical protein PoB_006573400 [Plakobranchus ocellatus]